MPTNNAKQLLRTDDDGGSSVVVMVMMMVVHICLAASRTTRILTDKTGRFQGALPSGALGDR